MKNIQWDEYLVTRARQYADTITSGEREYLLDVMQKEIEELRSLQLADVELLLQRIDQALEKAGWNRVETVNPDSILVKRRQCLTLRDAAPRADVENCASSFSPHPFIFTQ